VRALIVEDQPGVARGVSEALRGEGLTVDVETNGREGLLAAQSGTYDVVILDIMLPGMNGLRVCSALRAAEDWTPILMLTAKDGEYDVAEGLETGADDYLTKPFPMVVLVARIHALLRRPRSPGTAPFVLDDLRLDPVRHRCWRGDEEIDLSARELDVLTHLMTRPGETTSKRRLLDNIWGEDFAGDRNIVEVYIRRLRRKIDIPFGTDSIQTVRGVGYVMHRGGSRR
jgi:two-component system, OmpR family, response regulator